MWCVASAEQKNMKDTMTTLIFVWMILLATVDSNTDCSPNCKTCYPWKWVCMSCDEGSFLKRNGQYYNCEKCDRACISCEYYGVCGSCIKGRYFKGCERHCSNGCLDGCDKVNGSCTCKEHFKGDKCWECVDGRYGNNCTLQCNRGCLNNVCHKMNGQCECKEGFTGFQCDQCVEGRYGPLCQYNCSKGCNNTSCDQITGNCTSCKINYTGDQCTTCLIDLQQYINTNCGTTCPDECASCEISQNITMKQTLLCRMIQMIKSVPQYLQVFLMR